MKALKVYGKNGNETVYIDGNKVSIDKFENAIFQDNSSYGYGAESYLFITENEEERNLIDSEGLKVFENVEVPYATFKCLEKSAGCGMLKKGAYNNETKTIIVSCAE